MPQTNNCIVTYLYPGCEKFIKKFIQNLENQTFQNFDVLFFCDNFFFNHRKFKTKLSYTCLKINGSISEIRHKSLLKIKKSSYKKIYFFDVDDLHKLNRLEILEKLLDKHKIVFNDLDCIAKNKKTIKKNFFSYFFKNNEIIKLKKLYHQNFLGFGNTAIQNNILKKLDFSNLKKNIYPYDWYFFSFILFNNKACFTNKTKTYYNINLKSYTRLPVKLTSGYLIHSTKIKLNFYDKMKNYGKDYQKMYTNYLGLIKNKTNLLKLVKLSILKNKKANYSWWGGIKL